MKINREWVTRSAILAIGILLGWMLSSSESPQTIEAGPDAAATQQIPKQIALNLADSDPSTNGQTESPEAQAIYDRVARRFGPAMLERNEKKRLRAFETALQSLKTEEVDSLIRLFKHLDSQGLNFPHEWDAVWSKWGEVDGEAAAKRLQLLTKEPWAAHEFQQAFEGWTSKNPSAATAWLTANEEDPHYESAYLGFVRGIAEADLAAGTLQVTQGMPATHPMASKVMESLANAAVRSGQLPGLNEWFEKLSSDGGAQSYKASAFQHVWWRLEHASPEKARAFLEKHASEPWRNDGQYSETMRMLAAKQSPAAALEWASKLPPSPNDGRWPGVSSTLRIWQQSDPAAAQAWLDALPASPFANHARIKTIPVRINSVR